jgi:5-methylcytosine-specific restriction endonuclease McrBC regulatory subunit McrC
MRFKCFFLQYCMFFYGKRHSAEKKGLCVCWTKNLYCDRTNIKLWRKPEMSNGIIDFAIYFTIYSFYVLICWLILSSQCRKLMEKSLGAWGGCVFIARAEICHSMSYVVFKQFCNEYIRSYNESTYAVKTQKHYSKHETM